MQVKRDQLGRRGPGTGNRAAAPHSKRPPPDIGRASPPSLGRLGRRIDSTCRARELARSRGRIWGYEPQAQGLYDHDHEVDDLDSGLEDHDDGRQAADNHYVAKYDNHYPRAYHDDHSPSDYDLHVDEHDYDEQYDYDDTLV